MKFHAGVEIMEKLIRTTGRADATSIVKTLLMAEILGRHRQQELIDRGEALQKIGWTVHIDLPVRPGVIT